MAIIKTDFDVIVIYNNNCIFILIMFTKNKLAKLGDAIAISKYESITHPLTDKEMLSHLKR